MQRLHCTHFLKHQYPSTPHPLFPTYPRTVCGPRASAVLLIYTDQMNKVHSSEEAPRSFKMAPCVVVEKLEEKQRCSRATVSEQEQPTPASSPSRNHDSAAPRQHPLICTGAELIHPVDGRPSRWPQRRSPETRSQLCHFRGFLKN